MPTIAFGTGLFGTNTNNAPAGQTTTTSTIPQGSLFSNTQPATGTTNIFGKPAGTSMFGQTTAQPAAGGHLAAVGGGHSGSGAENCHYPERAELCLMTVLRPHWTLVDAMGILGHNFFFFGAGREGEGGLGGVAVVF